MKLNLIMIAIVALSAGACANNDVRPDAVSGPPTHIIAAQYRERCAKYASREGDIIRVSNDQTVIYIPEFWNGNPRLDGQYSGRVVGNQLLIPLTGHDGDPSGPDWQPSTPTIAVFEILESSESQLALRSLDGRLTDGHVVIFDKDYDALDAMGNPQ